MFHAAVVYANPHACWFLNYKFFIFLRVSGGVGRGRGGCGFGRCRGAVSAPPVAQIEGGVNPDQSGRIG